MHQLHAHAHTHAHLHAQPSSHHRSYTHPSHELTEAALREHDRHMQHIHHTTHFPIHMKTIHHDGTQPQHQHIEWDDTN